MSRILFVFHSASLKGGASMSGLNLVTGLQKSGHEVCAVCPAEGDLTESLRKNGVTRIVTLPYYRAWPMRPLTIAERIKFPAKALRWRHVNARSERTLLALAKEFKADIVHSNTSVIDIGFNVARKLNIPHIAHFREFGMPDVNAIMWHMKKVRGYEKSYGIAIGKEVAAFHSLEDPRYHCLIYNGVLSRTPEDVVEAPRSPYLLYVGTLIPQKGIEELLEAYASIPENLRGKHPLRIAGAPVKASYGDRLKCRTVELGIEADVEWLGDRRDAVLLMGEATALVVPSRKEAFGRTMAEGMFMGCPVIAHDVAGLKEQADNGLRLAGQEICLRYKDTASLTDAILHVLDPANSPALQDMARRAHGVANRLYSIESNIAAVNAFYKQIEAAQPHPSIGNRN